MFTKIFDLKYLIRTMCRKTFQSYISNIASFTMFVSLFMFSIMFLLSTAYSDYECDPSSLNDEVIIKKDPVVVSFLVQFPQSTTEGITPQDNSTSSSIAFNHENKNEFAELFVRTDGCFDVINYSFLYANKANSLKYNVQVTSDDKQELIDFLRKDMHHSPWKINFTISEKYSKELDDNTKDNNGTSECNFYNNITGYRTFTNKDIVVNKFLEAYPNAVPKSTGVDGSNPPHLEVYYNQNSTNNAKTSLLLYLDQCFIPAHYTYQYKEFNKKLQIQYFEKQKMISFLESLIPPSPYEQLRQGVEPENVECKSEFVKVMDHDGFPACVTPETKERLIERGWTKPV